jgi:hypothetical protein
MSLICCLQWRALVVVLGRCFDQIPRSEELRLRRFGRRRDWCTPAALLTTVVALGWAPSASAAPLRATFKPVPSRAVTAMISAARGGTLTLTAPGGTRIVVKIPPAALFADTQITATPITRFRVAPVHGGFVAGVQLAPEGLVLLKPGSVEFRPRRGLTPTRRYFLGSQGNGSDVHLAPPAFRKVGRGRNAKLRVVSKPIVPILHFSTVEGFDWSKANLRDVNDIRSPQSAIDRASQEIAKIMAVERQIGLLGWRDVADYSEVLKVVDRVRDHVIKPHIQVVTAALTSRCSPQAIQNAYGALGLALGFIRQEQQLGLLPDTVKFDNAALMGPILTATANCMLRQCSRYGPRISQFLFRTAREVDLLAGELESRAWYTALLHNIAACSKGEVHLDSTIYWDSDDGQGDTIHYTMRVAGRAPFEASPDNFNRWIFEEAPLEYQDVHGSSQVAGDCGQGVFFRDTLRANSNGVFRINQLNFSQLDPTKPDTSPPIENLILTITQDPTEYQDTLVDCSGTEPSHETKDWVSDFAQFHPALGAQSDPNNRTPFFNGPDFVQEAAPVIALATYSRPPLPSGVSENTLIEVISKPGPIEPLPNPFE